MASSRSSSGGSSHRRRLDGAGQGAEAPAWPAPERVTDPYAEAWDRLSEAALESEGALQAYVRRAIARGEDPPELAALLETVRKHAYRVVDGDLEGLDVDVVIEAVVAAALGEGDRRRRAALAAIG